MIEKGEGAFRGCQFMQRMDNRIVLLLLAAIFMLNCSAFGDVRTIPALQDLYIDLGENWISVYNQSDILLCAVNVSEQNGSKNISYPGCPVIQFDVSDLNVTDDDAAILLLRAKSILTQGDPLMVVLASIGSDWDESSDYTTFLVNILPAWKIIKSNDATAMSSNTDGDSIFAFDVSKKIKDAKGTKAGGDKVSFLLEANCNSSAEISIFPRESGMGPCLVTMPYPLLKENTSNSVTDNAGNASKEDVEEPAIVTMDKMQNSSIRQ